MSDWRRQIVSPTETGEPISANDKMMSMNLGSTSRRGDFHPILLENVFSRLIRDIQD